MSYFRGGSIFRYVDGESKDYIFPSGCDAEGKEVSYIEDYGSMSNEAIIEMIGRYAEFKDGICPQFNKILKEHILKRLSENLNVKLRKKPLSRDEATELFIKRDRK